MNCTGKVFPAARKSARNVESNARRVYIIGIMEKSETKFVELATPESLAVVRAIAAEIWPETFRSILPEEQIPYMMKMMYAPEVMERELASGVRFDALYVDGVPAGYVSYSRYDLPGTAKLHKVYLLSRYHGKGYGTLMLKHVTERCRELGFSRLRLNVNKHNVRAIVAYERNGFSRAESVKIDIGGGFFMDDYVMEKPLA